jgi:hypothetical protein
MQRGCVKQGLKLTLACSLTVVLYGCSGGPKIGNFDQPSTPSGISKLTNLLNFGQAEQKAATTPKQSVTCPKIMILDGTAAARFHADSSPSNANLRHQFSLGDVARECSREGDQLMVKVGVAGKVLLGPAGSPGDFSVPIRIAIVSESDSQPIVSRLYKAAATIHTGETQADFTVISDPLEVPFIQDKADIDYTIKVGIDLAAGGERGPSRPSGASSTRRRSS